jgi:cytochrome c553
MPALAGQPAADLAAKLTAFRDGAEPSTIMQRLVKPLTDAEIAELAAAVAAMGG